MTVVVIQRRPDTLTNDRRWAEIMSEMRKAALEVGRDWRERVATINNLTQYNETACNHLRQWKTLTFVFCEAENSFVLRTSEGRALVFGRDRVGKFWHAHVKLLQKPYKPTIVHVSKLKIKVPRQVVFGRWERNFMFRTFINFYIHLCVLLCSLVHYFFFFLS